MKTFNTYVNKLMDIDIYIKLNDINYLFVGEYEPLGLEGEEAPGFTPVNKLPRKVHLKNSLNGYFERIEECDNKEVDIPNKYHKAIIKKTFREQ